MDYETGKQFEAIMTTLETMEARLNALELLTTAKKGTI